MRKMLSCIAVLLALVSGACSGGGDGGDGGGGENLVVSLTDAPVDGVRAVNVTITAVRIHQSADAGPGAAGWRELPVRAPMPVDLLRLRGGVLYEKIVHSFRVADGTRTDLTLDFRADLSLHQHGNGDCYMQPVVHGSSTVH
jgi:hypothetical protein